MENYIDSLKQYLNDVKKIRQLTTQEQQKYLQEAATSIEARNKIIQNNLRLVIYVAKQFTGRGLPLKDLINEGNLGLLYAISKFDINRGIKFSTYAYKWINMYCSRAIANKARIIRLPVHIVQNVNKVRRARQDLTIKLGHQPENKDIADKLGMTQDAVSQCILYMPNDLESLDVSIDDSDDPVMDLIPDQNEQTPMDFALSQDKKNSILKVLNTLKPQESEVIKLRYGLADGVCHTFDEIGQHFGFTRARAYQIEAEAMNKLRNPARANQLKIYLEEQ